MNNKKFKELDAVGEDKLWEKFIKNSDQDIRDYLRCQVCSPGKIRCRENIDGNAVQH